MKLLPVSVLLVRLVAGRVFQPPAAAFNISVAQGFPEQHKDPNVDFTRLLTDECVSVLVQRPKFTAKEREDIWCKATSKGPQLTKASIMDEAGARQYLEWPYVQSPWEGDLKEELKTWGYLDDPEIHDQSDYICDFAEWGKMKNAFTDLGWDTRSYSMGGPNRCYHLEHQDGPAVLRDANGQFPRTIKEQIYEVDGKKYHNTGGTAKIGVNAKNGIIYMIHRESPERAARKYWQPTPVTNEALPKIRSSSDLMYAPWHRKTNQYTRRSISKFMSMAIMNEETLVIISRALKLSNPEKAYDAPPWPGRDFELKFEDGHEEETDAALALLGSPNGLGAGYFLVQHKAQLGGVKFVYKIRVFRGDSENTSPHLLFYVDAGSPYREEVKKEGISGRRNGGRQRARRAA